MRQLYRRAGWVIGLLATLASAWYIAASWRNQDMHVFASPRAAVALALGACFYLVGVIATALAWRRLLSDLGVRKRWRELAGILAVTQVGKYLPGNVAQHVGRATMSLDRGIGPLPLAVSAGVETLLLMLASVVVGAATLLLSGTSLPQLAGDKVEVIGTVALLATLVLSGLLLARRWAPRLIARFAPRLAGTFNAGTLPSAGGLATAFAIYCLVYLVFGAGIVLMAGLLFPATPASPWLLVASFALAWIIGFATPGAPAGLGVREGVMLLLLGTHYPPAIAGAIVVGVRIATTLGDLLLFPIGLWLAPRTTLAANHPPRLP